MPLQLPPLSFSPKRYRNSTRPMGIAAEVIERGDYDDCSDMPSLNS